MTDSESSPSQIRAVSAGGVEVTLSVAGLGGRCFAYAIDWHIRIIVAFAWSMAVLLVLTGGLSMETMGDMDTASGKMVLYVGFIPALLVYIFYHPLFEILMKGRTPGKRRAGVRIVTRDGQTPGVGPILIRNVFRIIDSLPGFYMLGIVVVLFTKQYVRIGDLAAGTLLVYEEKPSEVHIGQLVSPEGSGLTTEQREVVVELLERWNQLDRTTRVRMAGVLLNGLGETPEKAPTAAGLDRKRHARLTELLRRSS